MITAFGLYIAVMINGEIQESIPSVFDTKEQCLQEEKLYTKEIVVESKCFKGVFVSKENN